MCVQHFPFGAAVKVKSRSQLLSSLQGDSPENFN